MDERLTEAEANRFFNLLRRSLLVPTAEREMRARIGGRCSGFRT